MCFFSSRILVLIMCVIVFLHLLSQVCVVRVTAWLNFLWSWLVVVGSTISSPPPFFWFALIDVAFAESTPRDLPALPQLDRQDRHCYRKRKHRRKSKHKCSTPRSIKTHRHVMSNPNVPSQASSDIVYVWPFPLRIIACWAVLIATLVAFVFLWIKGFAAHVFSRLYWTTRDLTGVVCSSLHLCALFLSLSLSLSLSHERSLIGARW